eukprot:1725771-Rhodomonas_salina.1
MAEDPPMLVSGQLYCHCLLGRNVLRLCAYVTPRLAVQSWAGLMVVTSSGRQQPACGEVSSCFASYCPARSGPRPTAMAAARVALTHTDVLRLH